MSFSTRCVWHIGIQTTQTGHRYESLRTTDMWSVNSKEADLFWAWRGRPRQLSQQLFQAVIAWDPWLVVESVKSKWVTISFVFESTWLHEAMLTFSPKIKSSTFRRSLEMNQMQGARPRISGWLYRSWDFCQWKGWLIITPVIKSLFWFQLVKCKYYCKNQLHFMFLCLYYLQRGIKQQKNKQGTAFRWPHRYIYTMCGEETKVSISQPKLHLSTDNNTFLINSSCTWEQNINT